MPYTRKQKRFGGYLLGHPAERRRRGISLFLARDWAKNPIKKKKKKGRKKR